MGGVSDREILKMLADEKELYGGSARDGRQGSVSMSGFNLLMFQFASG